MKLPVLLFWFALLLCSCNMSRHYARLRLGNQQQVPVAEAPAAAENNPAGFTKIESVKIVVDSGFISPEKTLLVSPVGLKHKLRFAHQSVSPDTLLSAKYKPKPFDYRAPPYTFGPDPKPGLFSEDDLYSLRCILFCIGFMVCAALAIAIGATVDGSLFSLTGGIFCGLLCVAAVLFLVKVFLSVNFLW